MKAKIVIYALLALALIAIPTAGAAQPEIGSGSNENCRSTTGVKVVGVAEAGEYTLCIAYATAAVEGEAMTSLTATVTAPFHSGSVADAVLTLAGGCTAAAPAVQTATTGAVTMVTKHWIITHDADICRGYVYGSVNGPSAQPVYRQFIAVNVPQAENDTLEVFALLMPLLLFVILIFWAEQSGEWLIYVLALLAGSTATLTLWDEITDARLLLVGSMLVCMARAYWHLMNDRDERAALED